ncbi:putative quinol monooxygenase [Sphingomonas sp. H39-1-10]|uniref:putative quinol monooxygenase n=1 Tax=Sphingomonas pollutisoli TaxID=3030829 RepID=UPI0023B95581|nr:putative quinol monooxygenase [Sphingomonas pollutisoli]MDF0489835.1 putative quinol monooxygenase [Sphingomonas pollutisoli]
MLLIAGTIRLPAENVAAARDAIAAVVTATRAEDGCLEYRFAEDVLDPGLIHITERWRDRAALDAHFGTPHIAAWRAAGAALGIGGRALMLYEVGAGEAI